MGTTAKYTPYVIEDHFPYLAVHRNVVYMILGSGRCSSRLKGVVLHILYDREGWTPDIGYTDYGLFPKDLNVYPGVITLTNTDQ